VVHIGPACRSATSPLTIHPSILHWKHYITYTRSYMNDLHYHLPTLQHNITNNNTSHVQWYTLKTKTRKKNKFRSSTVIVLKMIFFWKKNVLYLKICSFLGNIPWFFLEKVTFLTLFWYWTWIRTKTRTLFLRV
jgi:hypothetical protein